MKENKVIDKIIKSTTELTVDDIGRYCAEAGVTIQAVCKVLAEGLRSDIVERDNNGNEVYREEDMVTRHKYMTSAMEVLRMVSKKDVGGVVVNNNITITADEFKSIVKEYSVVKPLRQTGEIIDVETYR